MLVEISQQVKLTKFAVAAWRTNVVFYCLKLAELVKAAKATHFFTNFLLAF